MARSEAGSASGADDTWRPANRRTVASVGSSAAIPIVDPSGFGAAENEAEQAGTGEQPATGSGNGTGSSSGYGTGTEQRKRGRPRGSKNGTGTAEKTPSAKVVKPETLVPYIFAFHMMLSSKMPEMAITMDEANQLATAICNYLRHTNAAISQKSIDTFALVAAVGMIYGTRLIAVSQRLKQDKNRAHIAAVADTSKVTRVQPGTFGQF